MANHVGLVGNGNHYFVTTHSRENGGHQSAPIAHVASRKRIKHRIWNQQPRLSRPFNDHMTALFHPRHVDIRIGPIRRDLLLTFQAKLNNSPRKGHADLRHGCSRIPEDFNAWNGVHAVPRIFAHRTPTF